MLPKREELALAQAKVQSRCDQIPPGRPGRVDDEPDLIEGQRFVDALRHLPGRYGADRVRAPPLAGRDGLLEHSVNDRT